jgi:hypothetical protein
MAHKRRSGEPEVGARRTVFTLGDDGNDMTARCCESENLGAVSDGV